MSEGLVSAGSQIPSGPHPARPSFADEQFATPPASKNALERPLAAVRRYKWLIAGVIVVSTVLGIAGSRFISPKYQVRGTIWLATEGKPNNERGGPIRSADLLSSTAWVDLFRSFRVVDAVVRKLTLYLEPKLAADAPVFSGFALRERFMPGAYELAIDKSAKTWSLRNLNGAFAERGTVNDSVGAKIGFLWTLPVDIFQGTGERKIEFVLASPRETSIRLLDQVTPTLPRGGNFLGLTYQDADPQLAARTLNAWIGEFVQAAADLKKRNVSEYAKILQEQLKYAETATQSAESAYQQFKINTITLPTEGVPVAAGANGPVGDRDPALMSFFDQKIEHDNLRNDREALEKNIASANATSAPYEGLLLIPSVAQSPGAAALREAFASLYQQQARLRVERQLYTDEYVSVKQLLSSIDELQKEAIPQLANQLLGQLRARELDFERRIASASKELQAIPPRTIVERRLSRAVTVSEGLYTNLQTRYAEARLAEASATPDISVLDTAIAPVSPTTNTAPKIILIAIAGGVAAALALALLLDTTDRRIRYADQASVELGLAIAGTVPDVPKGGIKASSAEQVIQFVESFRSLRMHVMNSLPGQRLAFAITSAAPGDGKSLISANLALSFAEAGLRTVLVDGDTRRGSLHRMFSLAGAGGLTEYLAGSIDASQLVRATRHENLSFVSCGRRHPRSPELLASGQMKRLVQHLTQSFDVVIFDTPPLAAGIDGFAISAAAGSVLMVLRMGQTERRLVSAKLSVLDRLPVKVLGAVLNGVSQTGEFEYYAYSPGYSIDSGDADPELTASSTV